MKQNIFSYAYTSVNSFIWQFLRITFTTNIFRNAVIESGRHWPFSCSVRRQDFLLVFSREEIKWSRTFFPQVSIIRLKFFWIERNEFVFVCVRVWESWTTLVIFKCVACSPGEAVFPECGRTVMVDWTQYMTTLLRAWNILRIKWCLSLACVKKISLILDKCSKMLHFLGITEYLLWIPQNNVFLKLFHWR